MSAGIIGLPGQARALTSQWGESERNRWILGSFSNDYKIYLVDYDEESSEISTMTFGHTEKVKFMSASTRKKELFVTVGDSATIWSLPESENLEMAFKSEAIHNLQKVASFPEDLGIKGVVWEPKGNKVSSYSQTQAHLYDLNASSGLSKPTLLAGLPTDEIYCSTWSPHSDRTIGFGVGKSIIEYDFRANQKQLEIQQAHEINIRCMDYNPNRPNYIASGGDDCVTRIWDTRNSKTPLKEIYDHSHWIWGVQFNKFHDQLLLTCSSDAQVNVQSVISISSASLRIFSPTMSDEEAEPTDPPVDGLVAAFEQHEESVYSASWSPADPWIFASVSFDGRFVVNQVPQDHKYKILSV